MIRVLTESNLSVRMPSIRKRTCDRASIPLYPYSTNPVLRFVNVHIFLEVPPALFTIVNGRLQLLFCLGRHVIDIVGAQIMSPQRLVGLPVVAGLLDIFHIRPTQILLGDACNDFPDFLSIDQVGWVRGANAHHRDSEARSTCDHLILDGCIVSPPPQFQSCGSLHPCGRRMPRESSCHQGMSVGIHGLPPLF